MLVPKEMTDEAIGLRDAFTDRLKAKGYEVFKRDSFMVTRKDQIVHLIQNDDVSGILFVRVSKEEAGLWVLYPDNYRAFSEMTNQDENTGLFFVFLHDTTATDNTFRGVFLTSENIDKIGPTFKLNDDGRIDIRAEILKKEFPNNWFTTFDECLRLLETPGLCKYKGLEG
jgi:hypothetical protein